MHSVGLHGGLDRRLRRRWERRLGNELRAARVGAARVDTDDAFLTADGNDPDAAYERAAHYDPHCSCQDRGLLAYQWQHYGRQ